MTRSYNRSSSRAPPLLPPREPRQRQAGGTWNPKDFPSPAPSPINSPKSPGKSTGAQAADRAAIVRRKRDNRGGHGTLPRLPHGLRERGSGVNQIPIAQRVTFGDGKTGQGVSDSCGTVPVSVAKPLPPKSTIYRKPNPRPKLSTSPTIATRRTWILIPSSPTLEPKPSPSPSSHPSPSPNSLATRSLKPASRTRACAPYSGGRSLLRRRAGFVICS
jgi:hypothetical protein